MDDYLSIDKSLRFIATDTTNSDSIALKLYFKGNPGQANFFAQNTDPNFKVSINECRNVKIITNRLYNKPASYAKAIDPLKDSPIFDDIKLPECLSVPDSGSLKTAYINLFNLPEGERLDKKCLLGNGLNNQNSCLPYLKMIAGSVMHGLKVLNMGNSFFKHGNIATYNLFLLIKNDTNRVYLDNMLYENNKYDDINQKPFKADMNMFADTMIQLLTGSNSTVIKEPLTSTFDLYHQVKMYFINNNIDVALKSSAINMSNNIKEGSGKCVTKAEFDYKLQKSIFNFIYRLKCTGTSPTNQFMDIDQALNHDFLKSASDENWDSLPADY